MFSSGHKLRSPTRDRSLQTETPFQVKKHKKSSTSTPKTRTPTLLSPSIVSIQSETFSPPNCDEALTSCVSKRNGESSFAQITHDFVTFAAKHHSNVVYWIQDGEAFVVQSTHKDLGPLLTKFFRHSKYSSFQRQLNMYGFKKYVRGKYAGAFHHPDFHRDDNSPSKLGQIKRRPPPSTKADGVIRRRRSSPKVDSLDVPTTTTPTTNRTTKSVKKKLKTSPIEAKSSEKNLSKREKREASVSPYKVVVVDDTCRYLARNQNQMLYTPKKDNMADIKQERTASIPSSWSSDYLFQGEEMSVGSNRTFNIQKSNISCTENDPYTFKESVNVLSHSEEVKSLENMRLLSEKLVLLDSEVPPFCDEVQEDSSYRDISPIRNILSARCSLDARKRLTVQHCASKKQAFYMSPIVAPHHEQTFSRSNSLESFQEFSKNCLDPYDRMLDDWSSKSYDHLVADENYTRKYPV